MTAPYAWVDGRRQIVPIKTVDAEDDTVALSVNASGVGSSDDKVLLLIGGNLKSVPVRCVSNGDNPRTYSLAVDVIGGGGSGSFITWRGDWNIGTGYSENDLVSYQGSSYIALVNNTAIEPGTDPDVWGLIAQKGDTGATGPTGPQNIPTSTAALPGIPTVGDADSGIYALASGAIGLSLNGQSKLETVEEGILIPLTLGVYSKTSGGDLTRLVRLKDVDGNAHLQIGNAGVGANDDIRNLEIIAHALINFFIGGETDGDIVLQLRPDGAIRVISSSISVPGFLLEHTGSSLAHRVIVPDDTYFGLDLLNTALGQDVFWVKGDGYVRLNKVGVNKDPGALTEAVDVNGNILASGSIIGGSQAAASVYSIRKLGTGATDATAGNDARLSDSRAPNGTAGGSLTGTYPNPTIATNAVTAAEIAAGAVGASEIADSTITDTEIAAANKDGVAATPSMRTLGTGSAQAAAGNDSRLSDSRAPNGSAGGVLSGTYPNPGLADGAVSTTAKLADSIVTSAKIVDGTIVDGDVAAANKDGSAGTASMRTLGTGSTQATAGNDARLSDSRAPNGTAGGSLNGTYPNPGIATDAVTATQIASGSVGESEIDKTQIIMGRRHYCKATGSGQSISTASVTFCALTVEVADTDGYHNNVTDNHRMVAPVTGLYFVEGFVGWSAPAAFTGRLAASIVDQSGNVHSSFEHAVGPNGSTFPSHVMATTVPLSAGDWMAMSVYHEAGSSRTINLARLAMRLVTW